MTGPGQRLSIEQFAGSLAGKLTPLRHQGFAYFDAATVPEEDLRELIHDPVGALPPVVSEKIGPITIILAPYLDRPREDMLPVLAYTRPAEERRLRSAYLMNDGATLFFAVRDENPSDYHQIFFNTISYILSLRLDKETRSRYAGLLAAEFQERVNGEVDQASWTQKQELPRRGRDHQPNTNSKQFQRYLLQSFADTMSLYMHGICCDIDVERGPRQMPSRWLRKRLEALYDMFPPPNGLPVFPEHLSRK